MAEWGFAVDHSTINREVLHFSPQLDAAFRRKKKRVGKRWRMDETYVKVKGQWKYYYRAVDKQGQTITVNQSGEYLSERCEQSGPETGESRPEHTHHNSSVQIPQQYHRARSPTHQEADASDTGLQKLSRGPTNISRHGSDDHDQEKADEDIGERQAISR